MNHIQVGILRISITPSFIDFPSTYSHCVISNMTRHTLMQTFSMVNSNELLITDGKFLFTSSLCELFNKRTNEKFSNPWRKQQINFLFLLTSTILERSYYVVKRKKDCYRRYDEFRFFFACLWYSTWGFSTSLLRLFFIRWIFRLTNAFSNKITEKM